MNYLFYSMSQKNESSQRRHYREGDKPKAKSRPHTMSNNRDTGYKTPPLPNRRSSIDDLINKRETLKQELKKINDSDIDTHCKYSNQKNYRNEKCSNNKRRAKSDHEHSNAKKRKTNNDLTPEYTGDFAQVESEDEESLIEKSRQRRKELLERLNISPEKKQLEKCTASNKIEGQNAINKMDERKTEIAGTTDMFSEHDEFALNTGPEKVTQDNKDENNTQLADNWDDSEGYYVVRVGDEIDRNRYTIKDILGQGVFSNVVKAQDKHENAEVAIKIIRRNMITFKTGLKEIDFLEQIKEADPDNKHHCIRFFRHFTHKNHLCLVIESLYMDLRSVIKKYGHHRGLNTKAIMTYSRQLLLAIRFLNKIGVVHADIKPDNILVNEKKNVLKLCDFGSAFKDEQDATPYLVSRFYRAPEIIMGLSFKHSIDIWSAACTMYEMATGRIMFPGSSNNKMLKCFMDLKGKMSMRMIKRGRFKDQHFNHNSNFLIHKKEEETGREKFIETPNIPITRDLARDLLKYSKNQSEIEEVKLMSLRDLLDKMFILDPKYRYTVADCLKHPFIVEKLNI